MDNQQPQGGLSQVAPRPAPKPLDQSAEADRIAAEQISQKQEAFDVNKEIANLNLGRAQLDAQIQKMQESLARRTQLPFDPKLMALGVGLAQPTKTGSFFESLGQGMSGYQKATMDELERQKEIDAQNLDLLTKQQALRQKLVGSAMLQNLGSQPQAAGQLGSQMQGAPGLPSSVTGYAPIGRKEFIAAQQIGDPATEKFLFDLQKAEIEAKKAADAGFTEVTIPYSDKKVKVRTEIADGFFNAARQAATTGDENILIEYMAMNGMIPPTRRKSTESTGKFQRPLTPAEEAAEKTRMEKTESVRAESAEKSAEQLKSRASVAFDNTQTAQDMISYAKNNPEVFRLLNTGSVKDVVMRAMGAGIQTPSGSVNLPVQTLKQLGLTNEQIDTLQMFAQSAAQLNVQFRKTMQGQGQITEKESELAAALGAMPTDSDVVIRLKSELLMERSKFDDKAFGAWLEYRKSGRSYDEFMHSNEYKALKSEYSDTLKNIRDANTQLLKKKPEAKPSAATKPSGAPESPLPPGYIKDPTTGVIRKKRQGE